MSDSIKLPLRSIAERLQQKIDNPAYGDAADVSVSLLREAVAALREREQPNGAPCVIDPAVPDDFPDRKDCLRAGEHVCGAKVPEQAFREPTDEAEIVRLEDMLLKRRDVKMERCDGCQRLFEIVNMREYGNDRDESERTYLCAPCAEAEDATTDRTVPCE